MKVLVDTNVLLAFLDEKLDFANIIRDAYLQVEFFALRQSLEEINTKRHSALEPVEWYLRKNGFSVVGGKGKADDLVLEWAVKNKGVVATRDFTLKKRLKKAGVQVISLKSNKLVL